MPLIKTLTVLKVYQCGKLLLPERQTIQYSKKQEIQSTNASKLLFQAVNSWNTESSTYIWLMGSGKQV